jgi:4-hydroxybenzoate polyprenyltransferase/phosphoserine phosphatase
VSAAQPKPALLPLCVDLDGTLVATDTLWESALALLRTQPLRALLLPVWLVSGRAALKRALGQVAPIDVAALPYRAEVLAYIAEARAAGRRVVLTTASTRAIAERVAAHTGVFDEVMASDQENLKGPRKREALVARFGERGFEYVGDSRADLAVWEGAGAGSLVGGSRALAAGLAARTTLARELAVRPGDAAAWLRALRVRQWLKNLLLFLPLLAAHRFGDLAAALAALVGFFAFGFTASAIYLANDLFDLPSDRAHPSKRERPFAAGTLSIPAGLAAIPLALCAAAALASSLPTAFGAALVFYVLVNGLYTLWLKRVVLADVTVLGGMYALRVVVGGLATRIPVSTWLIAFSLFFFLSLAFLKRFAELRRLCDEGASATPGRGYVPSDAPVLLALGPACAVVSALVLGLYVEGDTVETLYRTPNVLWALIPLLVYWSARIWLLAQRGELDDDPILFTTQDPGSYLVAALALVVFALAGPA